MATEIVCGIEGGASNSIVVLLNPQGQVIATAKGSGTNHHLIGMEECRRKIAELINEVKFKAGIAVNTPIGAVGLSLSGCELENTNQELVKGLKERYPNLALQYAVGSDAEGSIATVSSKGGVVCIAGTGSNTLLINPNGEKVQCGGWGNLLGDEGSAWNISWMAVKYCFDALDNFEQPPFPMEQVWDLIKDFFAIQTQADILDSFYANFDKSHIALLCKNLADLARNRDDKLAKYIFERAGTDLAKSIAAVTKKASEELINKPGGLHVICVGSVWLSWDLLQKGFVGYLHNETTIEELTLLRLKTEMGVGAAFMAADRLNLKLDRDYSKNYDVFAVYVRGNA
ncbi:N-acetyl-D-glucosamine kinase [Euwallacea similis]|uniref:N-acetyl-D-glucosamine kinase n=1 Tax=Euwallacea similis TaxID=1736056 RepID=UPI00344DCC59